MNTPRRKKNSSKVNLIISAVFHTLVIGALIFFAAREGLLGKQLKKIAVVMVPKEKPPEKPKEPEKPPEPSKEAQPKPEPQKVVTTPKVEAPEATRAEAPPPAAAPAPATVPAFDFADGAKAVQATSDAIALYKNFVEFSIRSKWIRPDNISDASYVAEVEVGIDSAGNVRGNDWKRLSGDKRWDESVKRALAATPAISRTPPKNFPSRFVVRFDVVSESVESSIESALR